MTSESAPCPDCHGTGYTIGARLSMDACWRCTLAGEWAWREYRAGRLRCVEVMLPVRGDERKAA